MRLLNVETLQLEDALCTSTTWPLHTILSHTWEDGEVSFQDLQSGNANGLPGYRKLRGCCNKSRREGFAHTWIDTCCIDKSSSAELSEAINSMFNWYAKAQVCYAYLSDVDGLGDDHPSQPSSSFRKSRWFTRGWTLQELLAPLEVVFLNKDWVEIGTKTTLASVISSITQIAPGALDRPLCGSETVPHPCRGYSVAQKMSWAAFRKTTREEDRAYSLLGLFGVNMPLLYGEGGEKAFARLQQEIMKQSSDDSLFAWSIHGWIHWAITCFPEDLERGGLIAWRPELFHVGSRIHTAATAEAFVALQGMDWTSATLAHRSTTYEETRQFISLDAPVLNSTNLLEISKTRIFALVEKDEVGGWAPQDDVVFPSEYTTEHVKRLLSGNTVIAILSCCFVFGRVGIVLERRGDGTYSRFKGFKGLVGIQVTKLPQCEVLRIRHKEGAGDECGLQSTSSQGEITGFEVRILEAGGYSTYGRCFEVSGEINSFGHLETTQTGDNISFLLAPPIGRVAFLYRHQGGDSVLNRNFLLAFHWSTQTSLRFTSVVVDDKNLVGEGWARNLSWGLDWRKAQGFQLSLGKTTVDVSMRKAPGRRGCSWYIFLSFVQV